MEAEIGALLLDASEYQESPEAERCRDEFSPGAFGGSATC